MARNRNSQLTPEGFTGGEEISLDSWDRHSIAVTPSGSAFFYLGYRMEDQRHDLACYDISVAVRDRVSRDSYHFLRLIGETLTLDLFLPSREPYRILENRFVILPSGADSYFGVLETETRKEDVKLTRQLFGATRAELDGVAACFGELTGRINTEYISAGRVTFSRTRSNDCDLCGCLIPREFPYLAFTQSQYLWGHISLHGFYRSLAFLCSGPVEGPVRRHLVDSGVDPDLLKRLLDCGGQYHEPIREV